MKVTYEVKINCEMCLESLDYVLNKYKDNIIFDKYSEFTKKRIISLEIESNLFSEFKKDYSSNAYEENEEINETTCKLTKINNQILYIKNDILNCNKSHLIPFWVFDVLNKKDLGKIILYLNSNWPLPQKFKFLKRIDSTKGRNARVLFFPQSENFSKIELIIPNEELVFQPYIHYVSYSPPITREQFERQSQHWPFTFHPNEMIEKLISYNSGFKQFEILKHLTLMGKAISVGKLSTSSNKVGIVIFNPIIEKVVIQDFDRRDSNCLSHAIIQGLNQMSMNQGGKRFTYENVNNMAENENGFLVSNIDGYLCNSCDIYISAPPCLMCSMALVHSRISRLFYYNSDINDSDKLNDDGLSKRSLFKLFSKKPLNHNFEVFEINM